MKTEKIRVSRKEFAEKTLWKKFGARASFVTSIILGVVIIAAFISLTINLNIFAKPLEIISRGDRKIIRVPAGGDLQSAIEKANGGDVIELQAGATYYGKINLPNKKINDYITIQTSAADKLPAEEQVNPSQAQFMAKIITRGKGEPAVSAENGAHHYRFIGIEFTSDSSDYIYNLVLFGASEKTLAEVPHHLEVDRSYLHPAASGVTRRGIALNSADTIIKNSYLKDFAFPGEETQAICGWTGSKNIKIINNHIEGGAENILFGGSDPFSAELIPSDIEIRANLIVKPREWRAKNYSMKTLFELKNAERVQFIGNYLEGNYSSALTITVRNQDGKAPFSTIEDVLIKDNIISRASDGINILGTDDTNPSATLRGLQIINNLLIDIGDREQEGGYFFQITNGRDVLIANNTVFQTGNIATFYGVAPRNFVLRDNIIGHGKYGIHGLGDVNRSSVGRDFFRNNVFINNFNVPEEYMTVPPSNFRLKTYEEIKFVNLAKRDFRLAENSGLRGRGTDKIDIGANIESIKANMPPELFQRLSQ